MSSYVFDIESDGLMDTVSRVWIICAIDIDTLEMHTWLEGDLGWKDVFDKADALIGHNIISYDLPVLEKILGYKVKKSVKIKDTLIMSQVQDYMRFGMRGHSLAVWGDYLGYPKVEHEDWSKYSEEMRIRCDTDVRLNLKVFDILSSEFSRMYSRNPLIAMYLRAEHSVAEWQAVAELKGWPFNIQAAVPLFEQMTRELEETRAALEPRLGLRTVAVDKVKGVVPHKDPLWIRSGAYHAHTANWFNVNPWSGYVGEERMIEGPYSRVLFEPLLLSSTDDMKMFLYRVGWEPTQWNFKSEVDPVTGKFVRKKTSPKITDDSLECLEGDGALYTRYLSTKSRWSVLKSWIAGTGEDGRLHGASMVIGTPSMRMRHTTIVNVPSADSLWGKEMRSLFGASPGWVMVGCDSSGNQARGLAHFLGDEEYIDLLLNGDIHQYNADVLTANLKKMGIDHVVPRSVAKRILYAFLFGAGGDKMWSYIFGVMDKTLGNKLKSMFTSAVPGLKVLLDKLNKIYGSTSKTGYGYIPSLVGSRIYVDSPHKLLVYLLQCTEKITCAAAVMLTMKGLEEEGIPYQPLIMYHDEENFMVPEGYQERAKEIGKQSFIDGPKLFGIQIMDGEAKAGATWYDVH